jgi:hypothetical protein
MTATHTASRRRRFSPRAHGIREQVRLNTHVPAFRSVDAAVLAGSLNKYDRLLGKLAQEVEQEEAAQ